MPASPELVESRLEALLISRIGHGGPWPGETYRYIEREASRRGLDVAEWLGTIAHGSPEHEELTVAAAVVHTQFFRHEAHFEHLADWLRARKSERRPIRIGSIGCATGQEPYSIVWVARQVGVPVEVTAADLNQRCIDRARGGYYTSRETTGLPGIDGSRAWEAPQDYRDSVTFITASIFDLPLVFPSNVELLFCRNLLFYFDPTHLARAWSILVRTITTTGSIVVAPVEALTHVPRDLQHDGPLGWLTTSAGLLTRSGRATPAASNVRSQAPFATPSVPPTSRAPSSAAAAAPSPGADDATLESIARLMQTNERARAEGMLHEFLGRRDDALGWFLLAEACFDRGERVQARIAFQRASRATVVPAGADLESVRRAAVRRAGQV